MVFINPSMVLRTFSFLILGSFPELLEGSVELFWVTLNFILALKNLLGSSLGAASGFLRAPNLSIRPMDRDLEAFRELLGAHLVASRCPRNLKGLKI